LVKRKQKKRKKRKVRKIKQQKDRAKLEERKEEDIVEDEEEMCLRFQNLTYSKVKNNLMFILWSDYFIYCNLCVIVIYYLNHNIRYFTNFLFCYF